MPLYDPLPSKSPLHKAARLIRRLAKKRYKRLSWETAVQILIADIKSHEHVKSLIPRDIKTLTVPVRGQEVFFNLKILWYVGTHLWRLLSGDLSIQGLYLLAVSKSTRSKIIISTIDNNSWGNLFRFCDVRVISIQNGARSQSHFKQISEQDIYVGLAAKKPPSLSAQKYAGLGSLFSALSGLQERTYLPSSNPKVVYVSQFRPFASHQSINEIELMLADWAYRYAQESGFGFYIAPDSIRNPQYRIEESSHFRSKGLGINIPASANRFTNLMEASHAALVVGHSSTLLLESVAIGIPTLVGINVGRALSWTPGDSAFDSIDPIFSLPEKSTYEKFKDSANRLIRMDESLMKKTVENHRLEVCNAISPEEYRDTIYNLINTILKV